MGTTTKYWDRKFLGKLNEFSNREEKIYETKHLRAYLKGYEQFIHGKNKQTGAPRWHKVKEELIEL